MGFVGYNLNPEQKMVGDCTVRAIATAMGQGCEGNGLCGV
nr:MAG TPA: endopeptidase [Bacteriophage sp.]